MSYTAKVITQERQYGTSAFYNWQDFVDYMHELNVMYEDGVLISEDESYFEVSKEIVNIEIERLEKEGKDKPFAFSPDETNGEFINRWKITLDESPKGNDYVSLEWY